MDAAERARLRRVCDKLMRQFATTVATLVEDEERAVEHPAFVTRLHAVFSNLAERKPEIAAYLLEERNFEHYCSALWQKYSKVDDATFEAFLDDWEEQAPQKPAPPLRLSEPTMELVVEPSTAENVEASSESPTALQTEHKLEEDRAADGEVSQPESLTAPAIQEEAAPVAAAAVKEEEPSLFEDLVKPTNTPSPADDGSVDGAAVAGAATVAVAAAAVLSVDDQAEASAQHDKEPAAAEGVDEPLAVPAPEPSAFEPPLPVDASPFVPSPFFDGPAVDASPSPFVDSPSPFGGFVDEASPSPASAFAAVLSPEPIEAAKPVAPAAQRKTPDVLAKILLDLDDDQDEDVPVAAPQPVLKEPEPLQEEKGEEEEIPVPQPVAFLQPAPSPRTASELQALSVETSLEIYKRLLKDMLGRESLTLEQLQFLRRMRTEKNITEADHMGVLADLGVTQRMFAQYVKNGQMGYSKPVVAGVALESLTLDLVARLIASEDEQEQISLAAQVMDAKRALVEDQKMLASAKSKAPMSPHPMPSPSLLTPLPPSSQPLPQATLANPFFNPNVFPPAASSSSSSPPPPPPNPCNMSAPSTMMGPYSPIAAQANYASFPASIGPPSGHPQGPPFGSPFGPSFNAPFGPPFGHGGQAPPPGVYPATAMASAFSPLVSSAPSFAPNSMPYPLLPQAATVGGGAAMMGASSFPTFGSSSSPPPPPNHPSASQPFVPAPFGGATMPPNAMQPPGPFFPVQNPFPTMNGPPSYIGPPFSAATATAPTATTATATVASSSSASPSLAVSPAPRAHSLFSVQGASAITPQPAQPGQGGSRNNSLFSALGASAVIRPAGGVKAGPNIPAPPPPLPGAVAVIPVPPPSSSAAAGPPPPLRIPSDASGSAAIVASPLTPLSVNNNGSYSPSSSPSPSPVAASARDPPPPPYVPSSAPPPDYDAPPSYSVAIGESKASGREYWTILKPIRVRDAPNTNANAIGKLEAGQICVSTQRQGNWFKHAQGWSMFEGDGKIFAQPVKEEILPSYQALITVRVRSAPSPNAPELGFLHPGQTVVGMETGGWLRHDTGWSMMSDPKDNKIFLQPVGAQQPAPVVAAADPCTYYEALFQVRIRREATSQSAELGTLGVGQVVRCLEVQGAWMRHEQGWSLLYGDVKGTRTTFLQQTNARPTEIKQPQYYEVVHPLRVRATPSIAGAELGTLELGKKVKCLEIQGFWLRHEQGWSMIHSDPAKGEKRPFLQPVQPAILQKASSQVQQSKKDDSMAFEVVAAGGLRVRDSPSDRGKEVGLLKPGQRIVGTDIQGTWVRHALGWSLVFGVGKKGEKIMYLKPL